MNGIKTDKIEACIVWYIQDIPDGNMGKEAREQLRALIARVQSAERWAKRWKRKAIQKNELYIERIAWSGEDNDRERGKDKRISDLERENAEYKTVLESCSKVIYSTWISTGTIWGRMVSEVSDELIKVLGHNQDIEIDEASKATAEREEQARREGYEVARRLVREIFDGTDLRSYDDAIKLLGDGK